MRFCVFVLGACAMLVVSTASAHGPQIQITVDSASGNTIVTRQLLLDEPYSSSVGLTAPASVYVMSVSPVTFVGQPVSRVKPSDTQVFGPGFTYGYDQTLGGDRLFKANLNLHVNGLQIWNGSAFVPTGPNKEQLGLLASTSNINPDAVRTTASGADLTVPISATYTADAHSSMRYTLLGDGLDPYAASRAGIYLVTLQLTGTQTTPSPILSPSTQFYYVLNKGMPFNDVVAVVNGFTASQGISSSLVQYMVNVPEPGTLTIVAIGMFGTFMLPRAKRCAVRR
jgi:PEP-CTERM motif